MYRENRWSKYRSFESHRIILIKIILINGLEEDQLPDF